MRLLIRILFIFILFASLVRAEQSVESIKPILEENWKELVRIVPPFHPPMQTEMWNYRITIPFPQSWPPRPENALVYYAFPSGKDFGRLVDAELVGAPWARITMHAGLPLQVELVEKKIIKVGIQGVRPLRQEEKEVYDLEGTVKAYISELKAPPDESDPGAKQLRRFYCTWISHNGVLAEQILRDHEAFFDWLACNK